MLVMRFESSRWLFCVCLTGVACLAGAQGDSLSLDQALKLAKERNGTVRSAYLNVKLADSQAEQAFGKFLPTLTPSYSYSTSHSSYGGSGSLTPTQSVSSGFGVVADWQLLDSGQRFWGYAASRANLEASRYSYLQTLRQTLFTVQQQYYSTLEAQELLVVANSQVKRTSEVLQQTKDFATTGQGAKINIFQADADYQNAKVQALLSQNTVSTAEATLKATIGWDRNTPLPKLVTAAQPASFATLEPLDKVLADGLAARADLQGQRKLVSAQGYEVKIADSQSLATWSLDANYIRNFSAGAGDLSENESLTFSVSLPWLDGDQTRQLARQALLSYQADKSNLVQAERAATADIESAYRALQQNSERVTAAQSAQDAAQQNYTATSESFRLGASTLIDVLTAQVTLETAQSNYIQAIYDYLISDVQLKLSTGKTLPGETD